MSTVTPPAGALDFALPPQLEASEPAHPRDAVRLMVAFGSTGRLAHARFADLPCFLEPGDVLVINTSGTLPAAVPGQREDGRPVRVHLSTRLPGGAWLVELRRPAGPGTQRETTGRPGERVALPGGGEVALLAPFPLDRPPAPPRLWLASLDLPGELLAYLNRHGGPIRYAHHAKAWPLSDHQTVYADEPGSAEMPSAGRAFTPELITELVAAGVEVAPLVLHTGVSSQESGEAPYPEPYRVPALTAERVNAARAAGRRVVAVGTTVVRALETVADAAGRVHPGEGWTELVVTPERGVRVVDGLLTGWHEPGASHLAMLEAVAGRALVEASYAAALDGGYRWHEFGDLHLLLP